MQYKVQDDTSLKNATLKKLLAQQYHKASGCMLVQSSIENSQQIEVLDEVNMEQVILFDGVAVVNCLK